MADMVLPPVGPCQQGAREHDDLAIVLASRPGRVADIYDVEIPRPRRIDSPEVATLAAAITDRLREEVQRGRRD